MITNNNKEISMSIGLFVKTNEEIENGSIILGDAILEMKKIPDEKADMIFVDPPYWMRVEGKLQRVEGTDFDGCQDEWDNRFNSLEDYEKFTESWLKECKRILKRDGSLWVIGGMQCIYSIGSIMQRLGYWLINDVIWHKKNPTPNFMGTRLNNSHETLIWAVKNKDAKFTFNYKTAKELNRENIDDIDYTSGIRKQMGSVWRFAVCSGLERLKNKEGKKLHSTQKPEELLYRIIAISTNVGNLVFDPFGGTMTTAAVAKRMGRRYITIENNEAYYEAGKERLQATIPLVGDIENAKYDEPVVRIKLEKLIECNYLRVGETIFFKKTDTTGILRSDGKVDINNNSVSIHDAPGIAQLSNLHVNGFEHCFVMRKGVMKSLGEIREEYRKEKLQNE